MSYMDGHYVPPSNDIIFLSAKMLAALAQIPNPSKRQISVEEYRGRKRIVFATVHLSRGGDDPCWQVCQNGKLKLMRN